MMPPITPNQQPTNQNNMGYNYGGTNGIFTQPVQPVLDPYGYGGYGGFGGFYWAQPNLIMISIIININLNIPLMAYYFYPSGQNIAPIPSVQTFPSLKTPGMSNKNDMSRILEPRG